MHYSIKQVKSVNEFSRLSLLVGEEAVSKLKSSSVVVFGIGGVGSYAVEALARCAVGNITLVDNDTVSLTNINRQLIALHSTIGKSKADAAKERILDINPDCRVTAYKLFYTAETADEIKLSEYDYIIDAIDTVSSKLSLIEKAEKLNIPIISCMGTGNKLDPLKLQIADIYKTSVCPLARVMRYELKRREVKKLKVLFSTEQPIKPTCEAGEAFFEKQAPGSVSFVPSAAGLIIAGEVIKSLITPPAR
ncbi:MAG: tRNA threonylcarbamoyladenosine dehydratase [Oscillospiraceae bacterium]|jgi:tRNA A37 threonylcarbamoyladenosine dehydratase